MANNTSDDELRDKVRSIIEAELSVSEVAAYAAGNKGAITNIMIEQTMQLIKQREEQVARDYAIKGAEKVLEDLNDWIKLNNPIVSILQHHISTMSGHIELKKLEYKQLTTTHKGELRG